MNKRSLLSLCGLAPIAALSPIATARRFSLSGEMILGVAGSPFIGTDATAQFQALIEGRCAKFAANFSAPDAGPIAARLFGPDEVAQFIDLPALDFPDR